MSPNSSAATSACRKTAYKVCLVGDEKTGKTQRLQEFANLPIDRTYEPTVGVKVLPLSVQTNNGEYQLQIWDCAGFEKYGGLREGYFMNSHGFIFTEPHCSVLTESAKKVEPNAICVSLPQGEPLVVAIESLLGRLSQKQVKVTSVSQLADSPLYDQIHASVARYEQVEKI